MTAPSSGEQTYLTLESFLARAHEFRLGDLPTEQPHPKTRWLAEWAQHDLERAIDVFAEIDRDAIALLLDALGALEALRDAIAETLAAGGRIFLCGCGATGRLSLSLECLWRESNRGSEREGSVVSLMAGGDAALIRSIEGFEDHPEFGARHLSDLGFTSNDLLVSCTEGGETSYVIGATELAAQLSSRTPWFLYCNPDHALRAIERSLRVIENPAIRKLCLATGPMALSGSTRLQASTVLMLAVGLPLLGVGAPAEAMRLSVEKLLARLAGDDSAWLQEFIEAEAEAYQGGDALRCQTDRHAITVLTDTTERAPTFSLKPFEHLDDGDARASLCYLLIEGAVDARSAWNALLWREPRPLDWQGFEAEAGVERLWGFDFSRRAAQHRARRLPHAKHHRFVVSRQGDDLVLTLRDLEARVDLGGTSLLEEHILLKLLLNAHSTLVMGRLGRYLGNVMTWVRPSNRKLIDRAIRYVRELLLATDRPDPGYAEIARHCFAEMASLRRDESIVVKTLAAVRKEGEPVRP